MLVLLYFLLFAFALAQLAQTFAPTRPLLAVASARVERVGIMWGGV